MASDLRAVKHRLPCVIPLPCGSCRRFRVLCRKRSAVECGKILVRPHRARLICKSCHQKTLMTSPYKAWLLTAFGVWFILCLPGCTKAKPVKNEIVMSPGMTITARTSTGIITVRASQGLTRNYTWEGATRSVEMWPREERWYGSLGLYYPGPGDHWKEHNGITRGVVEEGQQHFKTTQEALRWLRARSQEWTPPFPYVYTSNGLVVGWSKTLPRRQLNVEVWQIYINGKKPLMIVSIQQWRMLQTKASYIIKLPT